MRMLSILLGALSAVLLTNHGKTAMADEPEVKVYLFFTPSYDTALKPITPGQGVSYPQTNADVSNPVDGADPRIGLDYCEQRLPAASPSPTPTPPPDPEDAPTHPADEHTCK